MNIDDKNDLLGKDQALTLAYHEIEFPTYKSIPVKVEHLLEVILEQLENYKDREFQVRYKNYGVEVSICYRNGLFNSMILRGTGEQGELLDEDVVAHFLPTKLNNYLDIDIHANITICDRERYQGKLNKTEVPFLVKKALRDKMENTEELDIVCRVERLFYFNTRWPVNDLFDFFPKCSIHPLQFEYFYEQLFTNLIDDIIDPKYNLPQYGIIVEDANPHTPGAFPETHFIFDEATEI